MKRVELDKDVEKHTLHDHVFDTYISLRMGMAFIAFAFPIVLYLAGRAHGIGLEGSMSAYYWATPSPESTETPVRIWFIGGLFALAACFYLYKGFTVKENYALNLAAILAIGVAYFPECRGVCPKITPHGVAAVSAFVCLAFVTLLCSRDTLSLLGDAAAEAWYERWYRITSAAMLLSPVTATILRTLWGKDDDVYTFLLELAGIWAFAAFWLIKSHEMRASRAEERALRSEIGR